MAHHCYVPLATFRGAAGIDDDDITVAESADDIDVDDPTPRSSPIPTPRRHYRYLHLLAGFFTDNAGLLLIALSQGFASLMGVFVKKLNALDPPVHPLEVSNVDEMR